VQARKAIAKKPLVQDERLAVGTVHASMVAVSGESVRIDQLLGASITACWAFAEEDHPDAALRLRPIRIRDMDCRMACCPY